MDVENLIPGSPAWEREIERASETADDVETAVNVVTEIAIDTTHPTGRIVYTCQVAGDEICIMNSDGSGWKRLTDTSLASYNASLSPDGASVVFVSGQGDKSEIFELGLSDLELTQLTELGVREHTRNFPG